MNSRQPSRLDSDPSGAADEARTLLRTQPANRSALRLLGAALRRLGQEEEASKAEAEAIRLSLADPVLRHAAQALEQDRPEDAERGLAGYVRRDPNDPVALVMLAELGFRAGLFGQAESFLRKSLAIAPGYDDARQALARILLRQDRHPEALALIDEMLRHRPANANLLVMKATALDHIGEYDEAIGLLEEVLGSEPGSAALWTSYGHKLRTVGRLDDSVAAYRRALAADPASGEAWWSLANLKGIRLAAADRAAIEAALAERPTDDEQRAQLHFALAKAFEDAGDASPAFRHFAEGNRLRRSTLDYDPQSVSDEVERSCALFTGQFFSARQGAGCLDQDPIFILGMPRSGSTLVEQILASHSQIEGTSELPHIPALVRRILGSRRNPDTARYPEVLGALSPDALRSLGEEYLARSRAHRKTDRPFFTDKLPHNWSDIGLILLILPNARIIDARREPLSCCWSNYTHYFSKGHPASFDLAEMGRYYVDYVKMLAHYDAILPGRIHRVLHERLVGDPEREIRALLDHLRLPFESACLRFHETERPVRTVSAEQVRQPLNRKGLDSWRPYEQWLDPLKKALGPVLTSYPEVPTGL